MWKLKIAEGEGDRWLMSVNNHIGRQHWEFDPTAAGSTAEERAHIDRIKETFMKNRFVTRQSADLLMRMQLRKENPRVEIPKAIKIEEKEKITEEAVETTLKRALGYFSTIQAHDGHWPAEAAGPLFMLPILVITLYITGDLNIILPSEHQKEMKRYIYNHQNEDGGWGFHLEGHSTMFGSAFNYVALRLLGEGPNDGEHGAMARGRDWILDHGGAIGIPSWGKFMLTVLGVYEWEGCNPIPPELWLLPKLSPMYPGNMLCFARLVYMPMSYIYGRRFVGPITELIQSLRGELYNQPYSEVDWNKARNTCAKVDVYHEQPLMLELLWGFLHKFGEPIIKQWPFSMLREKALKTTMEHIHYEDVNSRYISPGGVLKFLSMLACWVEDPNSEAYKKHLARLPDRFWLAEDGMKIQADGSQLWSAALGIQAILASGLIKEYAPTLRKAHLFIKLSQVRENPSGNFRKFDRHISKGAWIFSLRDQQWQTSDCTAEALKAALLLSKLSHEYVGEKIEAEGVYDAVNVILSLQDKNGGFSAWEPRRTSRWMEKLNPTEFFEDVLIEREYVECTSSAIQALLFVKKLYPAHRTEEIERSISKGIQFIEESQNEDGSWYGCWGICFTYATWLAVEALHACGRTYKNSSALRKACEFLLSKQLPDGGWGESYLSCSNKVYTNLEGNRSNVVQTSWALLALIKAGQGEVDPTPIEQGIRLLIDSQMEEGDFPQQEITGVFMKNCTLHYGLYRDIFPLWALGEYRNFQQRKWNGRSGTKAQTKH